jgi:hypothetical protein
MKDIFHRNQKTIPVIDERNSIFPCRFCQFNNTFQALSLKQAIYLTVKIRHNYQPLRNHLKMG